MEPLGSPRYRPSYISSGSTPTAIPVGAVNETGTPLVTKTYNANSNLFIRIPGNYRQEGSNGLIAVGIGPDGQIRIGNPRLTTTRGEAMFNNSSEALNMLRNAGVKLTRVGDQIRVEFYKPGEEPKRGNPFSEFETTITENKRGIGTVHNTYKIKVRE